MSELAHPNWLKLAEKGVQMSSSIKGELIKARGLDLDTGILIAHALTLRLDLLGIHSMYTQNDFTIQRVTDDAKERIETHYRQGRVFGETRPADANFAVKVERWSENGYQLKADLRNDFEDRPDLGGGMLLQLAFVETVESLEL